MSLDEAWNLPPERLEVLAAYVRLKNKREDERFGMLAAQITNMAGNRAQRKVNAADFFPWLREKLVVVAQKKKVINVEELGGMLRRWVGGIKARTPAKGKRKGQ